MARRGARASGTATAPLSSVDVDHDTPANLAVEDLLTQVSDVRQRLERGNRVELRDEAAMRDSFPGTGTQRFRRVDRVDPQQRDVPQAARRHRRRDFGAPAATAG